MARMHSRAKGKSRSKKPVEKKLPSWVTYKGDEVELIVAKLAKEGKSPSQIGLFLRDSYGIPDVRLLTNKKIGKILEKKKLSPELPEDLTSLIRKAIKIRKHLEDNKQDEPSRRGLRLTESKINRLVKHYVMTSRLPATWKYDPKKAATYVE